MFDNLPLHRGPTRIDTKPSPRPPAAVHTAVADKHTLECSHAPASSTPGAGAPLPDDEAEGPPLLDVEALTTPELESGICSLAGHLAAATCRWLVLVGEYDRREAWSSAGTRSGAQWLSWRCGMTGGTAREHIRVGRALLDFQLIRDHFAAGRLTFSKVRAITRIATPALEAELVTLALGTTAAQVERIVREYRRAEDREHPPLPRPATLTSRWEDDGRLTVTVRLGPDDGALFLAALDACDESVRTAEAADTESPAEPRPAPDPDPGCPTLPGQQRGRSPVGDAEALLQMARTALVHGPTDSSGADRFEVILHADVDQLARAAADATAAGAGESVEGPTDARAETSGDGGATPRIMESLAHGRCHLRDGPAVLSETLRRMACDARVRLMTHGPDGSPKDVGRRQRLVTPALRALLEERDNGRCRFPSCRRRRRLHAHHIVHWADDGPTDLDNLVLLCPFHHQLVHEHDYAVVGGGANALLFKTPDGTPITDAPATTGHGGLDGLDPAIHQAPDITENTTTPEWWADPLHVADVVDGLLRMRPEVSCSHAA